MSERRWSLATHLRLSLGLGAMAIVLVPAAGYVWVVGRQTNLQVSARAMEELHEFVAHVDVGKDAEQLEETALRLQSQHPDHRIGFRIFDQEGRLVGENAGCDLFDSVAYHGVVDATERLTDTIVRATKSTESGAVAECAIDASQFFQRARSLQFAIGSAAVLAAAGSLLVVELLARRTSSMMARIAKSVRMHRSVRSPLELSLEHPPVEIREVVEALQRLVERARIEDDRSRLLLSGLAHELRAPIQNLVLEGEVALLAPRENAEYARVIEGQVELGRELADAVDNLVSLCRSGDSEEPIQREAFDLGIEVDLRLERLRRAAQRQGVTLRVRSTGDLSYVGDREAILRAVRNLVANAIEWTLPGTEVEIEIDGDGRRVEVRVLDRGPGVPDGDRERAFEPFVRLDSGAARRAGYGLGLSIVRRAAELHGGVASLEPRDGGGTLARLTLPRLHMRATSPSA